MGLAFQSVDTGTRDVGRGARSRHRRACRVCRRPRARLARERRRLRAVARARRRDGQATCRSRSCRRARSSGFGSGLSRLAGRLAARRSPGTSPRRPPEIYVVETETGDARPVTESRAAGLAALELRDPDARPLSELRRARDPGLAVPPRRRRPGAVRRSRSTAGPRRRRSRSTGRVYQYLLSRGIGVLATNIRGSTGYGKTYQTLIHHDWGGGDMEDWRHAAEWLKAQDFVDGGPARRVRRLVRRLRDADLRDAAARVLARGGRHRRPVESVHVRACGAAAVDALHGGVGRRSGHRGRLPARALADHVRRPGARRAARDPGSEGSAGREGRVRPDGRRGCASSGARSSTRSSRTRATDSPATRTRSAPTGSRATGSSGISI